MEDLMCWEVDYKFLAEQKKAQEARIEQEQRAGVIAKLLREANTQGEDVNVEKMPAKEVTPAK
jgi:hypothetical protein